MENLNAVKEKIKKIQKNFNPEKATYKVFDKLINEQFSIKEMLGVLARVRGVDKYPEDLKNDFFDIVSDLKVIEKEEKREQVEKERQEKEKLEKEKFEREKLEKEKLEKEKTDEDVTLEEHTKELKDIINNLEKDMKKPGENAKEVVSNTINVHEEKQVDLGEITGKIDNNKPVEEEAFYDPKTIPQKICIALIILVIITFIIMLLLFFFY